MQTALNRIEPQLPDDVDPKVFAGSTDDLPAIVLAASGRRRRAGRSPTGSSRPSCPSSRRSRASATVQVTGARDSRSW